ncbi:MAG TPA: hypothetical protein VGC19_13860 [Rhodanobacter sp.]
MNYVAAFFAGAFHCNGVPHLVAGLQGMPFPTPFAKPRGVGNSPALVNFLWGALNLLAGLALLSVSGVAIGLNLGFLVFVLGGLALGTHLSNHFGKVMRSRRDDPSA